MLLWRFLSGRREEHLLGLDVLDRVAQDGKDGCRGGLMELLQLVLGLASIVAIGVVLG